jgi:penicillin-binding protein 1A
MNFGKYARNKKIKQINSKSSKIKNLVSSTFFKLLVFFILVAGIIAFSAGLGTFKAIIDASPSIDHLLEKIQPEGYTTIIYDLQGNEVQKLHGADANRIYVEYDQIPSFLGEAFVAIEDERFWRHNGVDLQGFMRAIFTNIRTRSFSEGASTITQQIIKNNVLTTDVTIERKLQEMYLAVELEKHLSKEDILELYMNTVASGRGTNGVQTASQLYFNKDVWDISIAEAAVLASITNKPTRFDPVSNPENNRDRAERVLDKLLEQEYITQAEYDEAYNTDVYSQIQINSQIRAENASSYSYFVDEAINRLVDDLTIQKGYSEAQAYNLVYRGGLNIYITQDGKIQEGMDNVFNNEENYPPEYEDYGMKLLYSLSILKEEVAEHFYHEEQFANREEAEAYIQSVWDEYGLSQADFDNGLAKENPLFIPQPQAAMVLLDFHNGHVKAIAGGRGIKIGNQTFNRATQAKRQPGSTFKVVAAYLPAIDTGKYTLATAIDDAPFRVSMPNGSSYSPGNWYSGYRGLSTVREGIVDSMNILAVKTTFDIGVDLAFDYLLDLGFTTLHESLTRNGQTFTDKTLTLPLGGLTDGVTPLELTASYGAIANDGVYVEPIFYTRVLDHDGNILIDKDPITRTVMKDTTAFLLTDAMIDVIDYGTGTASRLRNIDIPTAGKTGTTSATKDLWFAGYTPYYAGALWMGYDDPQQMAYIRNYHKYMWRDVMEIAHEGLPYKDFNKPASITSALICKESGKLAVQGLCTDDPRGSTARYEYFAPGTVPTETCDVHKEVFIDISSGLFATEYCPEELVERRIMIQRVNPLNVEELSPGVLNSIADYKYEIPYSMIGEYCNLHGPNTIHQDDETEDQQDTSGIFDPNDPNSPFDPQLPNNENPANNNGNGNNN